MNITPLFAVPVGISNIRREWTEDELSFLKNLEFRNNIGNKVSIDTNVLEQLDDIKKFILDSIKTYVSITDPIPEDIEIYITQSWLNITTENEYHHAHTHPNSIISGVLYISANKEVDKLVVHNEKRKRVLKYTPIGWNPFNSEVWRFNIGTGDLILFPSDLKHEVENKVSDNIRVSLSFNTFLKGTIGSKKDLTELIL